MSESVFRHNKSGTVEIQQRKSGECVWRVRARNGNVLATGRGYNNNANAKKGARAAAKVLAVLLT